MGYQEVLIKCSNNKETRNLLKSMVKENIRPNDDMHASIYGVAIAKYKFKLGFDKYIKKDTEFIIVTGNRLYGIKEYLSSNEKKLSDYLDRKIIKNIEIIPIEKLPVKTVEEYKELMNDVKIESYLKNEDKSEKSFNMVLKEAQIKADKYNQKLDSNNDKNKEQSL